MLPDLLQLDRCPLPHHATTTIAAAAAAAATPTTTTTTTHPHHHPSLTSKLNRRTSHRRRARGWTSSGTCSLRVRRRTTPSTTLLVSSGSKARQAVVAPALGPHVPSASAHAHTLELASPHAARALAPRPPSTSPITRSSPTPPTLTHTLTQPQLHNPRSPQSRR